MSIADNYAFDSIKQTGKMRKPLRVAERHTLFPTTAVVRFVSQWSSCTMRCLTLLLLLSLVSFSFAGTLPFQHLREAMGKWSTFKERFNKAYASPEEETRRFNIFAVRILLHGLTYSA